MRYTLKQLEYFVATAEDGSIKQAAERLSISQPSISAAISHLEHQWGVDLFVRHHARGLSLTGAGQPLLREARLLLRQARALEQMAGDVARTVTGTLTVGCLLTLAPMIVPELGHAFSARWPDVQLQFNEGDPRELIDRLRRVEIDLAITYDLNVPDDVEFSPLATLAPHVLVSADHPMASADSVSLKAIASEPLVLLDLPFSHEYFLALFAKAGVEPCIQARSRSQDVVRTMVANGFGYTIANVRPRNMVALDGKAIVSLPLQGHHLPMTIGMATLRQISKPKTLEVFEEHCRTLINASRVPGMDLGSLNG